MAPLNTDSMRCPTCRAEQPWSDTCRRCKCDLRLLRELAEDFAAARNGCLQSIRKNQPGEALEQARRCFALHADADTQRLLAVCELLNGNWTQAKAQAEQLLVHARGPDLGAC